MNNRIRDFLCEEDGITALEYGILAAVVAGILVGTFRSSLSTVFDDIVTTLSAAVTKAST
jgi:pilus assembly protein Flp/PilA